MSNFQSVSTSGAWKRKRENILSLIEKPLITVSEEGLKSIVVYLSMCNTTEDVYYFSHISISKKNGTWQRVISNRISDNISRKIKVTSSAGNLTFSVENLGAFSLEVSLAYLIIN